MSLIPHDFKMDDHIRIVGPINPALEDERPSRMWDKNKDIEGVIGRVTIINSNGRGVGVETRIPYTHRWHYYNHIKKVKKWEVKKYHRKKLAQVSAKGI